MPFLAKMSIPLIFHALDSFIWVSRSTLFHEVREKVGWGLFWVNRLLATWATRTAADKEWQCCPQWHFSRVTRAPVLQGCGCHATKTEVYLAVVLKRAHQHHHNADVSNYFTNLFHEPSRAFWWVLTDHLSWQDWRLMSRGEWHNFTISLPHVALSVFNLEAHGGHFHAQCIAWPCKRVWSTCMHFRFWHVLCVTQCRNAFSCSSKSRASQMLHLRWQKPRLIFLTVRFVGKRARGPKTPGPLGVALSVAHMYHKRNERSLSTRPFARVKFDLPFCSSISSWGHSLSKSRACLWQSSSCEVFGPNHQHQGISVQIWPEPRLCLSCLIQG